MALCLLCELDATICVIQNISIIYVMCAYICCIYSKPVAYVSNSVLKMTLKMQGRGPNQVHRWGSCRAQTNLGLFVVRRRLSEMRWPVGDGLSITFVILKTEFCSEIVSALKL
jgi:hypothetical protein